MSDDPSLDEAVALIFDGCTTELEFLRREVAFMRWVIRQERTKIVEDCVAAIRRAAIERRAAKGDEDAKAELKHVSGSLEDLLDDLA